MTDEEYLCLYCGQPVLDEAGVCSECGDVLHVPCSIQHIEDKHPDVDTDLDSFDA